MDPDAEAWLAGTDDTAADVLDFAPVEPDVEYIGATYILTAVFFIELWRLFAHSILNLASYHIRRRMDPTVAKAQDAQKELAQLRREYDSVSAMDEFAKWARMDRKMKDATKRVAELKQAAKGRSTYISRVFTFIVYSVTLVLFYHFVYSYGSAIVFRFDTSVLGPRPLAWALWQPSNVQGGVGVLPFGIASYVWCTR